MDYKSVDIVPPPIKWMNIDRKNRITRKFGIKLAAKARKFTIAEWLMSENADVQVTAINKIVDSEPHPRFEGNTIVIPVCEEIIVKRVLIREEIRVTKNKTTIPYSCSTTLRKEKAKILKEANLWQLKQLLRSFRYSPWRRQQ